MTDTLSSPIRESFTAEVNHPAHYNSHPSGVECIELMRGRETRLATVIKYLWRSDVKHPTPLVDLGKAQFYLRDFRAYPSEPVSVAPVGDLTTRRRVVAECQFRDWVRNHAEQARLEDHLIVELIDVVSAAHDATDAAMEALADLLRKAGE